MSAAQAVPCPVPASAQKQRPHFPSCLFLSHADRLLDPRNGLGPPATAARAPQLHPRLIREPPPRPDGAPCVQLLLARSSPAPSLGAETRGKGERARGAGLPSCWETRGRPAPKALQPRAAPGRVRAYGWSCLRTDLATVSQTCGTEEQLSRGSPFPPPAPSLSHALGFTSGRWFYPLKKRLQQKSTQCSLSLVRWPGECPRRRQVYTCKPQLPTRRSAVSRPSEESPVCPQPVLSRSSEPTAPGQEQSRAASPQLRAARTPGQTPRPLSPTGKPRQHGGG